MGVWLVYCACVLPQKMTHWTWLLSSAAKLLLLLSWPPPSHSNCALYGCTSSLSFTCPTEFLPNLNVNLAHHFKDDKTKPTGSGCVTNAGKIFCPFAGSGSDILMSWDASAEYAPWKYKMKTVVTLPVVSEEGEMLVTDGDLLCAFHDDRTPLGPCIVQQPITGPVFDLTVVSEKFLYMLYKCGFMVAYFISDGTAYASIWLNTTLGEQQGTFIPLSNPAVSGERVYIIAAFKPAQPVPSSDVHLRLYAIDVRSIMVGRIKIVWNYDLTLKGATLQYLSSEESECIGRSNPLAPQVGSVMFEEASRTVIAVVNYIDNSAGSNASVMISLTDMNDSYSINLRGLHSPSTFQAAAYVSPNLTLSECNANTMGKNFSPSSQSDPTLWISQLVNGTSSIERINAVTGDAVYKLDKIKEFQNILLTSRLTIFFDYHPTAMPQCNGEGENGKVATLVFGYFDHKDSQPHVGMVDISSDEPKYLWSQKTVDSSAVAGQITTVGKGKDTAMVFTTTHEVYVYSLFPQL